MVSSLFIALFFFVILFFAAPSISAYYGDNSLTWPLRILSLILFLNAIYSVQTGLFSRKMQFKKLFIRSALAVPISGVVGIVMALEGYGLWSLVVHNLLNMIVIVVFMSFDPDCRIKLSFSKERALPLFSFSGKILLANLISGFGDFAKTMIIGKRYSTEDLAYYDKAYTYSNYITQIVNGSISGVLLPTFSRSQNDKASVKNMTRKSVSMTAFVMFPVLLWVLAAADNLVLVLLTDKWASCILFLQLFCVLRLPGCITSIDRQVYFALGNSSFNLYYEVGFFISNIVMLIITVPMGVIAIAWGATILELIGCFALFLLTSKMLSYSLLERFNDIKKPLCNAIIMMVATLLINNLNFSPILTLLLQVLTGVLIYICMAFIMHDDNIMQGKEMFLSIINK